MCFVSMIHDFYTAPINPTPPPSYDWSKWTPIRWEEYNELLRKAAEYDRLTGQKDCVDPKKQELHDLIEKVLKEKGIIPNG